jgi:glycosyltransferase involved in cell wall biosynthesis
MTIADLFRASRPEPGRPAGCGCRIERNTHMKCPSLSELPLPETQWDHWPWIPAELDEADDVELSGLPKISIVTPSYNQAGFIEETIRSILLQGYPDIEYIIIDGGSTDGSVDLIKKYDKWISYWVSEPDRGQSHAINKGWERCTGEIVAWLNSDDVYQPGAFFKVAKFMNENKRVGMLYGECDLIDESGRTIGACPSMAFDLKALVCNQWFISQPATFFRKATIDRIGGINEQLQLIMDWEYFLRIALERIPIKRLSVPTAKFRTWENAKTNAMAVRSGMEKLTILDWLFKQPGAQNQLGGFKKQAYGYVHQWTGEAYRNQGRMWRAMAHFLNAWRYQPILAADRAFRQTTLATLIEGIKGNGSP